MPEDPNTPTDPNANPTPTIDTNSQEFRDAVAAAVETATSGLKENRDTILGEKKTLAKEHEDLKAKLAKLGDLTVVEKIVKQFNESSEAKLIAEGKIEEVLASRTEAMRQDAQTRVEAATAKITELEEALASANGTIAELKVGSQLDAAALKLKCADTATEDIRRAGLDVFSINPETHEVEARNADGNLILGPDAKTPLTPEAWLETRKKISPHWWGPSAGGGAGGGRRPDGSTDPKQLETMSGRQLLQLGLRGRK